MLIEDGEFDDRLDDLYDLQEVVDRAIENIENRN